MDLSAIKKMQEESDNHADGDFLYTKEIKEGGEGIYIRLMPPTPRMAGIPWIKVKRYWINKKPYICPSTFDRPSPILEEIKLAKEDGDPELLDLCEDKKMLDIKTEYWIPVLHLDLYDKDGEEREKPVIIGDKVKIFPVGPMIKDEITKIILSSQVAKFYAKAGNETKDKIADRVKGFNIIISKTGKGKETEYHAERMDTPQVMPKKLYEAIPDVVGVVEEMIKSDEYLRSVIRNYLYGEEIIDEEKAKAKAKKQEAKKAAKPTKQVVEDEEEEEEENEVEDEDTDEAETEEEDDDQEEEEEVKPTPKKKEASKPVEKAKQPDTKATTKKPAAKVTETKKVPRNVLDDVNDLD